MKTTQKRKKPLGKNGFKYRPKYGLIIQCRDEAHQKTLFEAFKQDGHKVKVVAV